MSTTAVFIIRATLADDVSREKNPMLILLIANQMGGYFRCGIVEGQGYEWWRGMAQARSRCINAGTFVMTVSFKSLGTTGD